MSNALWPPAGLIGLVGTGDGRPENAVIGEGAEATLSGSEPLLITRLSVCNGLGVIDDRSFDDIFLSSATESIDDRLALLACPSLMIDDAALDLRFERSGTSGVLGPDKMDRPEFRVFSAGRITCDAPFR